MRNRIIPWYFRGILIFHIRLWNVPRLASTRFKLNFTNTRIKCLLLYKRQYLPQFRIDILWQKLWKKISELQMIEFLPQCNIAVIYVCTTVTFSLTFTTNGKPQILAL